MRTKTLFVTRDGKEFTSFTFAEDHALANAAAALKRIFDRQVPTLENTKAIADKIISSMHTSRGERAEYAGVMLWVNDALQPEETEED